MAISHQDILSVADQLYGAGGEPASRSATSRYYYASMHGATEWLSKTPGVPSAGTAKGGLHTVVEGKLRTLDPTASTQLKMKGRSLAVRLVAMKARRVSCDYDLTASPVAHDFAQQKADAHKFATDCASPPP